MFVYSLFKSRCVYMFELDLGPCQWNSEIVLDWTCQHCQRGQGQSQTAILVFLWRRQNGAVLGSRVQQGLYYIVVTEKEKLCDVTLNHKGPLVKCRSPLVITLSICPDRCDRMTQCFYHTRTETYHNFCFMIHCNISKRIAIYILIFSMRIQ